MSTVEQVAERMLDWLQRRAPIGIAIAPKGAPEWRDTVPDFPSRSRGKLIAAAMHLREQGLVDIHDIRHDRFIIGVRLAEHGTDDALGPSAGS